MESMRTPTIYFPKNFRFKSIKGQIKQLGESVQRTERIFEVNCLKSIASRYQPSQSTSYRMIWQCIISRWDCVCNLYQTSPDFCFCANEYLIPISSGVIAIWMRGTERQRNIHREADKDRDKVRDIHSI